MKSFIEIIGWNNVVYKVNINQITHIYKPAIADLPLELRLNVKLTRVFLSCGTEMVTRASIEEIEKLVEKAEQN